MARKIKTITLSTYDRVHNALDRRKAQEASKTEWVTADELKAGDHVIEYGVTFELTECTLGTTPHENKLPSYSWGTRVVDFPIGDGIMLRHEAERWRAQGNKLARFARVKR